MKVKGGGKGWKGSEGKDRPEMWDAVARLTLHDTAPVLAALLQTLLIPSESPVVKAMRGRTAAPWRGAGGKRTEKKRLRTTSSWFF